jgi:hypothetical protein
MKENTYYVCTVCNERCKVTEGEEPKVCLATGGTEAEWQEFKNRYITVSGSWDVIMNNKVIGSLYYNPTMLMDEDNEIVMRFTKDGHDDLPEEEYSKARVLEDYRKKLYEKKGEIKYARD